MTVGPERGGWVPWSDMSDYSMQSYHIYHAWPQLLYMHVW
jgi:hypothetical protein